MLVLLWIQSFFFFSLSTKKHILIVSGGVLWLRRTYYLILIKILERETDFYIPMMFCSSTPLGKHVSIVIQQWAMANYIQAAKHTDRQTTPTLWYSSLSLSLFLSHILLQVFLLFHSYYSSVIIPPLHFAYLLSFHSFLHSLVIPILQKGEHPAAIFSGMSIPAVFLFQDYIFMCS